MDDVLKVENLVVEAKNIYNDWITIVNDISFEVKKGETIALIGESGAGKTTVALAVLGYARPGTRVIHGHVWLGDIDLLSLKREELRNIRGVRVAYVAQSASAAMNPAMTLGNQVAESLLVHDVMESEAFENRVIELCELLDLPNPMELAKRYPHQVSGGQRQRFMIAMALACSPEVLVLDEPTTGLDVTTQIEVLKAVKDIILGKDSAGIYVSHDLSVVTQVADRIIVMYNGEPVEEATTAEILKSPKKPYTKSLFSAVRQLSILTEELNRKGKVYLSDKEPVLKVQNIRASYEESKRFKPIPIEKYVLHDNNLKIYRGEVVGLVGESGCGKSTLARVIAGLHKPISGNVAYNGKALKPDVSSRKIGQLRMMQIVFQSPDTALNPAKRVKDEIGRPLELYFGLKGGAKRDRIEELLSMVKLKPEYMLKYPTELSGGEKQRVSLARAFAAEPEIILCDEVLSALDTIVGSAILDLMKDLQEKSNVAYLFISHDLATVATISDRVVVIYAGNIVEVGITKEVFLPPYHPYTLLLMSSIPRLRSGWLEEALASEIISQAIDIGVPFSWSGITCSFWARCPVRMEGVCDNKLPTVRKVTESHVICCHREVDELFQNIVSYQK